jgi:hypothetical protein
MKHRRFLLFVCLATLFLCGFVQWQADYKRLPVQDTALTSLQSKNHPIIGSIKIANQSSTDAPYDWLTFIESDKRDLSFDAELDLNGNFYVATNHYLSDDGSYRLGDENEISITKIASDGRTLWGILVDAEPQSWSLNTTLDNAGGLYVSGISLKTWGEPLSAFPGDDPGKVMFIAKYRTSDGALLWNTFLGKTSGFSLITSDESNNIYAVWQQDNDDTTRPCFLAKLNGDGILQWSRVLVPSNIGYPEDVYVDNNGNIFVLGISSSSWGKPIGEPIREPAGGFDTSLAKFNADGVLLWDTFLGGTDDDVGSKIMSDENGFLYVTGYSDSTWGNPISTFQQGMDGFLAKLEPDGALLWNTFFGGLTGDDLVLDMEIGIDGNLYLAGGSESTWGSPANEFTAGQDGFIAQFDLNGSLLWNTFIGGSGIERLYSIEIDDRKLIRVAGLSFSGFGNPINPPRGGGSDIFAASMSNLSDSQSTYRDAGPLVPVLTTHIPTPLDISTDPSVIGTNVLLAILLMLPFAVAVEFFSQTLSENEGNLIKWIPPLAWIKNLQSRSKEQVMDSSLRQNLLDGFGLLCVALFYGIVFSLLDETWRPFSAQGLVLLGSMTFSCGIIGTLDVILQWRTLRKWKIPAEYNVQPTGIFLSVFSVGISRLFALLPGLMFGSPEILKVDENLLDERQNQSLIRISTITYLAMALVSWLPTIATTMIQRGAISNATKEIVRGVEAFLLITFAMALETLFLQLLALSEGLGTKLKKSNRWAWAASLATCAFFFLHTLLNPRYDLVETLQQSNITLFTSVMIVFIVIAFGLHWMPRKRESK